MTRNEGRDSLSKIWETPPEKGFHVGGRPYRHLRLPKRGGPLGWLATVSLLLLILILLTQANKISFTCELDRSRNNEHNPDRQPNTTPENVRPLFFCWMHEQHRYIHFRLVLN